MPVVSEGLIEEQDVVITNDQPLGIWHLNGIAMAPVVKALQSRGEGESVATCLEPLGLSPELNIGMERWLVQNNWIRT